MRFIRNLVIFIVIVSGLTFFVYQNQILKTEDSQNQEPEKVATSYIKKLEVTEGSTYGILMQAAGVPTTTRQEIFVATKDIYDLSNIRLGRTIDLVYDKKTEELQQLIYQIDTEEKLYVTLQPPTTTATTSEPLWIAERISIPYEIKIKTTQGIIETSMWESGLKQGIDERAIIAFADVFQWLVDFAWEVRVGDTYKFIYEERYLDSEYVMPGKIIAGKFVNDGRELYAFYYQNPEGKEGYFDQNGESTQRIFLKAPLAFKYISSGFTTGLRYIQAFNISTGHRAIDYAAAYGTPVRSVGDGTIVFAGWDGAYGRKVSVRHNSTYTTNYCHLSKIAVKYGQKVSQGQTIGYVGSTGLSTGPHLHYEMVKYGTKINPLREEFPSTEGIEEENKEAYLVAIKDWREKLDK